MADEQRQRLLSDLQELRRESRAEAQALRAQLRALRERCAELEKDGASQRRRATGVSRALEELLPRIESLVQRVRRSSIKDNLCPSDDALSCDTRRGEEAETNDESPQRSPNRQGEGQDAGEAREQDVGKSAQPQPTGVVKEEPQVVYTKEEDALRQLLKAKGNPNTTNSEGEPLLLSAVRMDSVNFCSLLLAHGADAEARNAKGQTALHVAAELGREAIVEALLKHGAQVNAVDKQKMTPLHLAAKSNHLGAVRALLAAGADLLALNRDGLTAEQCAAPDARHRSPSAAHLSSHDGPPLLPVGSPGGGARVGSSSVGGGGARRRRRTPQEGDHPRPLPRQEDPPHAHGVQDHQREGPRPRGRHLRKLGRRRRSRLRPRLALALHAAERRTTSSTPTIATAACPALSRRAATPASICDAALVNLILILVTPVSSA